MGVSILCLHLPFDLVLGCVVVKLHALYTLGVTLLLLQAMVTKNYERGTSVHMLLLKMWLPRTTERGTSVHMFECFYTVAIPQSSQGASFMHVFWRLSIMPSSCTGKLTFCSVLVINCIIIISCCGLFVLPV